MLAIILGLVIGKPLGIFLGSWLAVHFRIAVKPDDKLVASSSRRRRAWRTRLHHVALYRGRGVPRSGRFRGRKDRHFHRFDCCGL